MGVNMRPDSSQLWPINLDKENKQRLELLRQAASSRFVQLLKEEGIECTSKMTSLLADVYLPLADWLIQHKSVQPLVVGINGAQGSGKTTLVKILASLLEKSFGKRVVSMSIDDFYLPRYQREQLADKVHSLFITRGVPGTHDVALAKSILQQLRQNQADELLVPVFDKALDDRLSETQWKKIQLPVDIVLFEGWCVGAVAEADISLGKAVNSLEAEEDKDGIWRKYVNEQLTHEYKQLFAMLDILLMIDVPSFDKVYEWRLLQEEKLRNKISATEQATSRVMSDNEIRRFIMHFERVTRNAMKTLPQFSNLVLKLDNDHQISEVIIKH